jgi:hypothetical protein
LKKEEAKAVQVSIKQSGEAGQAKGPLGGGNGRGGAGLFAPLRAEEAESWKPLEHYHSNVRFLPPLFFPFQNSRCEAGLRLLSGLRELDVSFPPSFNTNGYLVQTKTASKAFKRLTASSDQQLKSSTKPKDYLTALAVGRGNWDR